ncbi:transport protein particle component [Sistotremastrum niveocremeum HHB9708]|uniref:Transport protein particle component n=1 Tax=Sistotremastrum niveocremeum HHB9708 TaxID=1314777 RepID=A0A164R4X9_9AGAM|nr:transport protein particle component [Sistotremastrum niveocremeum HHB9708]
MNRDSLQTPRGLAPWAASSASLASPSELFQLAEPTAHQIDGVVMDYFLIELVETMRASTEVAIKRRKDAEQEMINAGLLPASASSSFGGKGKRDTRDSIMSGGGKIVETEEQEGLRKRLETVGAHVGSNLAEKLSRDKPRFTDTLDSVKFICKDVWTACWEKQVDNLRTNHRGVYVLQDNSFRPIARLSSWDGQREALQHAAVYVAFSAGLIRGVLQRLGINATVTTEIPQLPQCIFQVKLTKGH